MPHLHSRIDNIGYAPDAVGRFLDLSPSTMRRYIKDGQAPKPVMLALYWESSWGLGHANADAVNDARRYFNEDLLLRRQVEQLKSAVSLLEHELDRRTGSANSPIFNIS